MDTSVIVHNAVNSIPWDTLLQLVIASPLLSAVMAVIIKVTKRQNDMAKLLMVFTGATLLALVHYIVTANTVEPTIVFMQGAILTFTAQPFYYAFVKPFMARLVATLAKADAFDANVLSAAQPVVPRDTAAEAEAATSGQ